MWPWPRALWAVLCRLSASTDGRRQRMTASCLQAHLQHPQKGLFYNIIKKKRRRRRNSRRRITNILLEARQFAGRWLHGLKSHNLNFVRNICCTYGPKTITAELGRALAVVKVTLQVNGNSQFLGVRPPKTIGAIKIKSGTNDYVGKGTHMQYLVTFRLLGASPHIGEI